MNAGIGEGHTFVHHRAWSDQLYAVYARGRDARFTASIVGEAGLSGADRRALEFARRFEGEFIHQGDERRSLEATIEVGWRLLEELPRDDLSRLDESAWAWRREQAGATA
jgi:V/A-type H+-transporting ATPase subunit B